MLLSRTLAKSVLRLPSVKLRKLHTVPDFSLWDYPGTAFGVSGFVGSCTALWIVNNWNATYFISRYQWISSHKSIYPLDTRIYELRRECTVESEKEIQAIKLEIAARKIQLEKECPPFYKRIVNIGGMFSHGNLLIGLYSLVPALFAAGYGDYMFSNLPEMINPDITEIRQLILVKSIPVVILSTCSTVVATVTAMFSPFLIPKFIWRSKEPAEGEFLGYITFIFYGLFISLFLYPLTIPIGYFTAGKIIDRHIAKTNAQLEPSIVDSQTQV